MEEPKECRCPVCINHDLAPCSDPVDIQPDSSGWQYMVLTLSCVNCCLKIYGGVYKSGDTKQFQEVLEESYKRLERIWDVLNHDFPVNTDLEDEG